MGKVEHCHHYHKAFNIEQLKVDFAAEKSCMWNNIENDNNINTINLCDRDRGRG